MANERLYQFPSKASPVPADIIFAGDSADAFDEVNITIAALIGAYPNLIAYAGLTLGANSYSYTNNSSIVTAGTITALAVSLLADSTIAAMQTTLGYTATPTASVFAGWDANVNLSSNSFISGYTTTATAASTTTLTVGSTYQQFFTGTTTQNVVLPVTSTLALGQPFYIVNNSTGVVTVKSSGGNTIQAMAANTTLLVTCILQTGTTATSWYADYNFQNALSLPLAINQGGTGVTSVTISPTASAWAGWDANKNFSSNSLLSGYTTTATAASTTTLTVGSTYQQFFTGSTTQTVLLPVTSTLVLGQAFFIVNNSSGNVTVQSSGANNVQVMTPNTTALVTCILTSGTTAASWYVDYNDQLGSSYLQAANNLSDLGSVSTALTNLGVTAVGTSAVGQIAATATNDNAASGKVGELISSVISSGSALSLTSASVKDVTSISLTAGDWEVSANVTAICAAGTVITGIYGWTSSTSASVPDSSLYSSNNATQAASSATGLTVPTLRYSLSATTTIYLSTVVVFSVSTATICGGIYARRAR